MNKHIAEERLKFQLDRIALFSDAVFAIAITLLVIEIKVPALPFETHAFNEAFGEAINHMIPEFIGFIISFVVIGNYWRSHHSTFAYATDYDRKLLGLNNWFLFTIVCMPFTTSFMSKYVFAQPYLWYSINVMLTGLLMIWIWKHIANKKNNLSHEIPPGVVKYKIYNALVVVSCFFISIPINYFFGGGYARLFLIFIFPIEIITTKYFKKKYQLGKHF